MVWTKEKPTVPGWYWLRKHGTGVVEIREGLCSVMVEGDGYSGRIEEFHDFVWAGPIPEPEEPEE